MNDLLGYKDKNVVLTGAATGMGAAAAKLLLELGANVYVLDINEVGSAVTLAIKTDMKDKASIDDALGQLPDKVDALFNCAGVPHPPFSATDTVLINFVGLRHLTEAIIPRMAEGGAIASIASTAGMGWRANQELVNRFLDMKDFDEQAAWILGEPELKADPYGFSKQSLIMYTMRRAGELSKRNIRINCIAPSPTSGAFTEQLTQHIDESVVSLFFPPVGRFATPEEMGEPLVLLNSKLASFISGVNIPIDYGYTAEVLMEQRDNLMGIS